MYPDKRIRNSKVDTCMNKLACISSRDNQLKLVWQWIKTNHINISEADELLEQIYRYSR